MSQFAIVPFEEVKEAEPAMITSLRAEYQGTRAWRKGWWPPFDDLLRSLQNATQNITQIGKQFGLSPDQMSALDRRFFAPILGCSSIERRRRRTRARRQERLREISTSPQTSKVVIDAAENAGLTVHLVPYKGAYQRERRCALRIDGHLCRIHFLRAQKKPRANRKRCAAQVSLFHEEMSRYDAHIFCVRGYDQEKPVTRLFVLPLYVLKKVAPPSDIFNFWIPFEQSPVYRNHHSRIDWWKYENAWHLLEGEK